MLKIKLTKISNTCHYYAILYLANIKPSVRYMNIEFIKTFILCTKRISIPQPGNFKRPTLTRPSLQ